MNHQGQLLRPSLPSSSSGRGNSYWNDELVAELVRLYADNFSASQIGKRLGITRNAVCGKAFRLGLRRDEKKIKRVANRKVSVASPKRVIGRRIVETNSFRTVRVPVVEMTKTQLRQMLTDAVRNTR